MYHAKRVVWIFVLSASAPLAFILAPANVALGDEHPTGVPVLSSRPGAAYTVYLDFAGFNWYSVWGASVPGNTPAFEGVASNGAFSAAQQADITDVWSRVAEMYAPFDVNVTTRDPAIAAGKSFSDEDRQVYYDSTPQLVHTVIGNDDSSWLGSSAGGVTLAIGAAQEAVNGGAHTNWVFDLNLSSLHSIALAAAHEDGHELGLNHQSDFNSDGTLANEYTTNNNSALIGPVMGAPSNAARNVWAVGNADFGYAGHPSEQTQNDVAVILDNPNMSLVNDGIGHSLTTATDLSLSGNAIAPTLAKGIITPASATSPTPTSYTSDYFAFYVAANDTPVTLTANAGGERITSGVADPGATLDASLSLYDATGNLIDTANTSSLSESFNLNLNQGVYYLKVASAGAVTGTTLNGDTYYDMGSFFLTGSGFAALPASTGGNVFWQAVADEEGAPVLDGTFSSRAHWNTGIRPGDFGATYFTTGSSSPYTVTFAGDVSNAQIDVSDNVRFDLGGHTYTYSQIAYVAGGGTLSLTNGTLGGLEQAVGRQSAGTLDVGSGATLKSDSILYSGIYGGTGTVNVTDGGQMHTSYAYIAYTTSPYENQSTSGTVNVDGLGSRWINDNAISMAEADATGSAVMTAKLNITNGGLVTTSTTEYWDHTTIKVDGKDATTGTPSTFNAGAIHAYAGDSAITISNGGVMNDKQFTLGETPTEGRAASGTQTINVYGAGSHFNTTGSAAVDYVGLDYPGALTIGVGAAATGQDENIGINAAGAVTVRDAGSSWSARKLTIGGNGTLSVAGGAQVTISNGAGGFTNDNSVALTGQITVDGGPVGSPSTLSTGPIITYPGSSLEVSNGGILNYAWYTMGQENGTTPGIVSIIGAGSQFNGSAATSTDYIGYAGPSVLNILSGATAIGANEQIGTGSSGTVTVSGAGSKWTVASATLGSHGDISVGSGAAVDVNGALTLNSGASVTDQGSISAQNISLSDATLTSDGTTAIDGPAQTTGINAANTITVDGAQSNWNAPKASIGANGTLNVTGGGKVTISNGAGGFSNDNRIALTGQITVDGAPAGNASMLSTGPIITYPGGSLTISNGGIANYTWYTMGQESGAATGAVTVTGARSQFNSTFTTSTDYIGYAGPSALNIENGATAIGANEHIGSGASGTVTVNGAGSKWTVNTATLGSHGTMAVGSGAAVDVNGDLALNSGAAVTNHGSISAENISLTSASLSSDGTTAIDGPAQTTGINAADAITVSGGGASWGAAKANIGANGALSITGGGNASFSDSIELHGQIDVDGAGAPVASPSTLTTGPIVTYMDDAMTVRNGGIVNYTWYTMGQAAKLGTTSTFTITGAGTQFNSTSTDSTDYVGYQSASVLNILDGATAIGANEQIGYVAPGTVTVSGTGSKWDVTSATVYLQGAMTVGSGASVDVKNTLKVDDGAAVTNYGSIIAQTLDASHGVFTSDGTTEIDGGSFFGGNQTVGGTFINHGAVVGPAGVGQDLTFIGDVTGGGSFAGNILFEQSFTPDDPVPVALDGNTGFASTDTLTLDIAGLIQGTEYDYLDTSDTGLTTFGGTLAIDLIDGFNPALGNSFNLFGGPTTGMFDTIDLPTLSDGLFWNTSQLYSAGVLSVSGVPEPASLALLGIASLAMLPRRRQERPRLRRPNVC